MKKISNHRILSFHHFIFFPPSFLGLRFFTPFILSSHIFVRFYVYNKTLPLFIQYDIIINIIIIKLVSFRMTTTDRTATIFTKIHIYLQNKRRYNFFYMYVLIKYIFSFVINFLCLLYKRDIVILLNYNATKILLLLYSRFFLFNSMKIRRRRQTMMMMMTKTNMKRNLFNFSLFLFSFVVLYVIIIATNSTSAMNLFCCCNIQHYMIQ